MTNLSAMRSEEARRFVAAITKPQCLAYRYRPDGAIVFAEELRRRSPPAFAVAAAALLTAACSATGPEKTPPPPKVAIEAMAAKAPRPMNEAIHELPGTKRRAEYREELRREQAEAVPLDCDLLRQLFALGGYGAVIPDECEGED